MSQLTDEQYEELKSILGEDKMGAEIERLKRIDQPIQSLMPDEMVGYVPGGNLALAAKDFNDGNYLSGALSTIPVRAPFVGGAIKSSIKDMADSFAPEAVTPEGVRMPVEKGLPDSSKNEAIWDNTNWNGIKKGIVEGKQVPKEWKTPQALGALDEMNKMGSGDPKLGGTPAPEGTTVHDYVGPLNDLRAALYGERVNRGAEPSLAARDRSFLERMFDKPYRDRNQSMGRFADDMIGGRTPRDLPLLNDKPVSMKLDVNNMSASDIRNVFKQNNIPLDYLPPNTPTAQAQQIAKQILKMKGLID